MNKSAAPNRYVDTVVNILVVGGAGIHRLPHGQGPGPAGLRGDLLQPGRFDALMHFSFFILVGKSVQQPAMYFACMVTNTLHLLDALLASGVQRFIFSSTAATFGEPYYTPIDEGHPQAPINPYAAAS
jgi:UDP-glucose 4-epimerase